MGHPPRDEDPGWISEVLRLRCPLLELPPHERDDYCAYAVYPSPWDVLQSLGPPLRPNAPWPSEEPQGPPAPAPRPAPTVRVAADPGALGPTAPLHPILEE